MGARWTVSRVYEGPPNEARARSSLTILSGNSVWMYNAELPGLIEAWKSLPDGASLATLAQLKGGKEWVFLFELAKSLGCDDATMAPRDETDIAEFERSLAELRATGDLP